MSGHSKWSTIKRQKGLTDVRRGQTFTKLAKFITIAVKLGGSGDVDSNPRLRMAVDEARSVNMPKDNIQRAIDKGLGKGEGVNLEEVLYEGFGPGKVAFIIEGVTDNKMRTTQEIKNIFERNGGALAGQGAVSYMFERLGEIKVKGKGGSKDDEMLELIDLGATDVEDYLEDSPRFSPRGEAGAGEAGNTQSYLVYTESPELNTMGNKITQVGYGVESQGLVYKPTIVVEITDKETAQKVMEFAEKLEDLDDVQKVFANFNISDESLV